MARRDIARPLDTTAATVMSDWSGLPLDLVAQVVYHLPLPAVLAYLALNRHYNRCGSRSQVWRHTALSLELHVHHHTKLTSLPPSHSLYRHVQNVRLSHSLYSQASLSFIQSCQRLRSLTIHQSQLDSRSITKLLSSLSLSLASLRLSSLSLSNDVLAMIGKFPAIHTVDLHRSTGFDGAGLHFLSTMPMLIALNLEHCSELTDADILTMRTDRTMLQLQSLRLSSPSLTDAAIDMLCQQCPNLTSLSLTGTKLITVNSLKSIAQFLPSLVALGVSHCPLLRYPEPHTSESKSDSDSCDCDSVPMFPSLKLLTVSNVTDCSLSLLLAHHPQLQRLAVDGPHALSHNAFSTLSHHTGLVELGLYIGRRDRNFNRKARDLIRRHGKESETSLTLIIVDSRAAIQSLCRAAIDCDRKCPNDSDEWEWTSALGFKLRRIKRLSAMHLSRSCSQALLSSHHTKPHSMQSELYSLSS